MSIELFLIALSAVFCFSWGSILFTIYSRATSVIFMNLLKALVACLCFAAATTLGDYWEHLPYFSIWRFLLSGLIGLCVGDLFLMQAFVRIGPARTLVLFGFQPLILGLLSLLFLGQALDLQKLWAILFFILCLITFSVEHFRAHKSWGAVGIGFALLGIILDAMGLILTRQAFDEVAGLHSWVGNFWRTLGAIGGFFIIALFRPLRFVEIIKAQSPKARAMLVFACVLGTFISLSLYLHVLKQAHLATLSGITITGPLFASVFEGVLEKRWPSRYFWPAFLFFAAGVYLLL